MQQTDGLSWNRPTVDHARGNQRGSDRTNAGNCSQPTGHSVVPGVRDDLHLKGIYATDQVTIAPTQRDDGVACVRGKRFVRINQGRELVELSNTLRYREAKFCR